eukprot:TRINITY_DN1334_c1_g1_i8.p1 TRINITY_DN1334_c1_g1~~TRINITY_DN1334_c1_g1_i8.p1  ORF type:complete len:225 (-),score=12.10 TRINITY_DN1334_c1_g1_i8:25-699(-)
MSLYEQDIAVIGGGWYGCHVALKLAQCGATVTLFEAKEDIFQGVSGSYGMKLHTGPHYPRSKATRRDALSSFDKILSEYPNFVVKHKQSIYALGIEDAEGLPPRVNWPQFEKVCLEARNPKKIDLDPVEYKNLYGAYSVNEPFMHMDKPAQFFRKQLPLAGVRVVLNHKVSQIESYQNFVIADGKKYQWVLNCTSYQDFTTFFSSLFRLTFFLAGNLRKSRGGV